MTPGARSRLGGGPAAPAVAGPRTRSGPAGNRPRRLRRRGRAHAVGRAGGGAGRRSEEPGRPGDATLCWCHCSDGGSIRDQTLAWRRRHVAAHRPDRGRGPAGQRGLERATGWAWKTEGLCRDDACMPRRWCRPPADRRRAPGRRGRWRHAGWPVVHDDAARTWALGEGAAQRAAALSTLQAPDFELPDLDGRMHRLSDYRGRRVFMVAWASWCGCRLDLPVWQGVMGGPRRGLHRARGRARRARRRPAVDRGRGADVPLPDRPRAPRGRSTTSSTCRRRCGSTSRAAWCVRPRRRFHRRLSRHGPQEPRNPGAGAVRAPARQAALRRGGEGLGRGAVPPAARLDQAGVAGRLRMPGDSVAEAHARFRLAQALVGEGRTDEARAQFAEAARLHPDSWAIWRQGAGKDERGLATGADFWARWTRSATGPTTCPSRLPACPRRDGAPARPADPMARPSSPLRPPRSTGCPSHRGTGTGAAGGAPAAAARSTFEPSMSVLSRSGGGVSRAWPPAAVVARRAGPVLAGAHGAAGGAVSRRRRDRSGGPRHRAAGVAAGRPADRGRQQGRRRRHARRRRGSEGRRRRLHPAADDEQHACHLAEPDLEAAVRPGQGLHADRAPGRRGERPAGVAAAAGEERARAGRLRGQASGRTQLRQQRQRHHRAPDGGGLQGAGRRLDQPRPYKGTAQAIPDLVAGNVQVLFDSIASGMPHVKSGRLRGLAVTGDKRSALAPSCRRSPRPACRASPRSPGSACTPRAA